MIARKFNTNEDYKDVSSWWAQQDWPVLPASILSSSGFIVVNDEMKLAATWIFATNCPIYIMEWTVGNPDASWEDRSAAIKMVTEAGCDWAKQDGAAQVFTMTKSERFMDKLQEYGFTKTESGMTHLVRSL